MSLETFPRDEGGARHEKPKKKTLTLEREREIGEEERDPGTPPSKLG